MLECQPSGCRPSDLSEKQAKQIKQVVTDRAAREPSVHRLDCRGNKKPSYVSMRMVKRAANRTALEARRRAGAST